MADGRVVGGRYALGELLGSGAMGNVYAARDRDGSDVAIKILNERCASDAEWVARFRREALVVRRIPSRCVVPILAAGWDGAVFYIVLERLHGETLEHRLRRERTLPVAAVRPIANQLLGGLKAAHVAGVVHRDVKPANIFLAAGGPHEPERVRLLDFGIAKYCPPEGLKSVTTLTVAGDVLGTVRYMAPEQCESSADVDARADLFSVGVVLFRALTGAMPFEGVSYGSLLHSMLTDRPRTLRLVTGVPWPDAMENFFPRALAPLADRFQSADAMLDAWVAASLSPGQPLPSTFDADALDFYDPRPTSTEGTASVPRDATLTQ